MFTKRKLDTFFFFLTAAKVGQELLASHRQANRQTKGQQGYVDTDKNINRQCSSTRVHICLCYIDLLSVWKPLK